MTTTDTTSLAPDAVLTSAQVKQLWDAIAYLTSYDADRAREQNDVGFSQADTGTGHALAQTLPETWTPPMIVGARMLVNRYKGQLARGGIILTELELSEYAIDRYKVKMEAEEAERLSGKSAAHVAGRSMKLTNVGGTDWIECRWPYNETVMAEIKAIDGRKYGPYAFGLADKTWFVPLYGKAAVLEVAKNRGFAVDPAIEALDDATLPPAPVTSTGPDGIRFSEDGKWIEVRWSRGHPDFMSLVGAVKQVGTHKWMPDEIFWRFPADEALQVEDFARRWNLPVAEGFSTLVDAERIEHEASLAASRALDAEIELPALASGQELRPFQRAGVAYIIRKRRTIVGDEMGLGKTVEALVALVAGEALPAIVICPNSAKLVWKGEIKKFFPWMTVRIMKGTTSEPYVPADVTILNYDVAQYRVEELKALNSKALVLDEAHAIKNGRIKHSCPECGDILIRSNVKHCKMGHEITKTRLVCSVKRTGAVADLASSLPEDAMILDLSGTPVTNRVPELVNLLTVMRRIEEFGGGSAFIKRYTRDGRGSGVAHAEELHELLRARCMIRRTKAEVFTELPAVEHASTPLDIAGEKMAAYFKAENDVIEYLANRARELALEAGEDGDAAYWQKKMRSQAAEQLARISALKRASTDAKIEAVWQWVDDFLDDGNGKKILLFAENIDVVEGLAKRYGDKAVKIRGGVSTEARAAAVERFQTDDSCRVFVGNIAAASEALTLTAASNVAFVQFPWTPGAVDQSIARCFGRVNDLHGATAHYLIAPNTIEEDIVELIDDKRQLIDAVIDNKEMGESVSILGDLLVRLAERGLLRQQAA
jgi:hypothetical protein